MSTDRYIPAKTHVIYSNHWGFSREQSIGRRSLDLGIFTNPDDRQRAVEKMRNEGRCLK